jgi:predicted secreted acid phosphatase
VFITSRTEDLRDATARNLRSEGFEGYAQLIMKSPDSPSTKVFKSDARARLVASGKIILMNVGDQLDDLDSSTVKGNFLLPNPFY